VIAVLCLPGAGVLIVLRLISRFGFNAGQVRFLVPALSIAILSLLITPAVWAGISVIQNVQAQIPAAGPTLQGNFGGIGSANPGILTRVDTTLIRYLQAHQGHTTYLVATDSSNTAEEIILATNKPVMPLGGFGADSILTTAQLVTLIHQGTVRFFLLSSFETGQLPPPQFLENIPEQYRDQLSGGSGAVPQSALTTWVAQHCTVVPASLWQSSSTTMGNTPGPSGANQLYDCATTH